MTGNRATAHLNPGAVRWLPRWAVVITAAVGMLFGLYAGYGEGTPMPKGLQQECPTYTSAHSRLTVSILDQDRQIRVDTVADIMLTGAKKVPAGDDPAAADLWLLKCLAPSPYSAKLQKLDWANDVLTARITLPHGTYLLPPDDPPPIGIDFGAGDATLTVDPCRAEPGTSIMCKPGSASTVQVTVANRFKPQSDRPSAVPIPAHIDETGDGPTTYQWIFDGPPRAVTSSIGLPPLTAAVDSLTTSGAQISAASTGDYEIRVNLNMLAFSMSAFLTLVFSAVALRSTGAGRPLVLLALALALLAGLDIYRRTAGGTDIGHSVVAAIGWTLVISASSPSTKVKTAGASLLISALAGVALLEYTVGNAGLTSTVTITLAAACTALSVLGAIALWRLATTVFQLRSDDHDTDFGFRSLVNVVGIVGLCTVIGYLAGTAWAGVALADQQGTIIGLVINFAQGSGAVAVRQLAGLTVVAFIVRKALSHNDADGAISARAMALMIALAAPWSANAGTFLVAILPMWLFQVFVLNTGINMLRMSHTVPADLATVHSSELLAIAAGRSTRTPCHSLADEIVLENGHTVAAAPEPVRISGTHAAELLLYRGLAANQLDNARRIATWGGYLAVVPVAYFLWTTLGEISSENLEFRVLTIVLALLVEAARWIVGGFAFGYLYRVLPGRIGPVKALWFTGLWALSAVIPTAIARGLDVDLTQQFIYRAAQFALFVIVLAVTADLLAIRAAGGGFRDLRSVYSLQNYGEVAAAVTPALLLALTLAQQIAAGSGFEVANAFLSGIGGVLK